MNTVYKEDVYFGELRQFYAELKKIAAAAAVQEHLDLRGVPRGSVVFSSPIKRYTAKDGSVTEYQYTNSFLYISGRKHYISKKYPYPSDCGGHSRNDVNDERNYLVLQERLKLRMEAKAEQKHYGRSARLRCNFLNANKDRKLPRILYKKALAQAEADFRASEEHTRLSAAIDRLLERGPMPRQEDSRLSEIYNDLGERQYSKNEVIAARCLRDCGFCCDLEPPYPGSAWRADFKLHTGGSAVWLEIAGMRRDPAYEERLQKKRSFAACHGLPLVVIDMTDYPDAAGRPRTRLHYDKLQRILQNIRLGILPREIVTPY